MPVPSKCNLEVGCLRNKHPPLEAERSDLRAKPCKGARREPQLYASF